MSLFQNIVLKKYLTAGNEKIADAYSRFADYFLNPDRQENIRNSKEEQFQEGFLMHINYD